MRRRGGSGGAALRAALALLPAAAAAADLGGFLRLRCREEGFDPGLALAAAGLPPARSLMHTLRVTGAAAEGDLALKLDLEASRDLLRESEDYASRLDEAYAAWRRGGLAAWAGKRKLDWGPGLAWSPSDRLSPPRDKLDLAELREGLPQAGFQVAWGSWRAAALARPRAEAGPLQGSAKLGLELAGQELGAWLGRGASGQTAWGLMQTGYLLDELELHLETATQQGRELPRARPLGPGSWAFLPQPEGQPLSSFLLGLRYFRGAANFRAAAEYFRNAQGYGSGEARDYFEALEAAARKPVPGPPDLACLAQAAALAAGDLRQDYAYLSLSKGNPLGTLEAACEALLSLDDGSGALLPSLRALAGEAVELRARGLCFWGAPRSHYGSGPLRQGLALDLSYRF